MSIQIPFLKNRLMAEAFFVAHYYDKDDVVAKNDAVNFGRAEDSRPERD